MKPVGRWRTWGMGKRKQIAKFGYLNPKQLHVRASYRFYHAAGLHGDYEAPRGSNQHTSIGGPPFRQRAWVAAKLANLNNGERASQICEASITRDQAASMLNVSPRSVDSARVVRDHGVTELPQHFPAP